MKNETLRALIKTLVEIDPDPIPVLSVFLDLEQPRLATLGEIEGRARLLRQTLPTNLRSGFDGAMSAFRDFLNEPMDAGTRGAAYYHRWGDKPVRLVRRFGVPLENRLSLGERPEIYPLIELKDVYHRFVIVITTEHEARILETTLGEVTEEILSERADLRERFGREWTRGHYQNHKREREEQFVREKIRVLDELMSRRGHNHLIIVGSPKMVARLKKALPKRLREKVVSTASTNPRDGLSPIIREAIHSFVEAENHESHQRVDDLQRALHTDGLAVIGYDACRAALAGGYADLLLVDQDHPESAQREDLVRRASKHDVPVETVKGNALLGGLGGFGCLLRYLPGGYPGEKVSLLAA